MSIAPVTNNVNVYQQIQNITVNSGGGDVSVAAMQGNNNVLNAVQQSGVAKQAVSNYLMTTATSALTPQNLEQLLLTFAVEILMQAQKYLNPDKTTTPADNNTGLNGVDGVVKA